MARARAQAERLAAQIEGGEVARALPKVARDVDRHRTALCQPPSPGHDLASRGPGWSWTLDRSVAEDFARRYREDASDEALLVTADVDRAVVIAYLRSGGEDELILDPDALDWGTITITRVPPSTSADRVSSG